MRNEARGTVSTEATGRALHGLIKCVKCLDWRCMSPYALLSMDLFVIGIKQILIQLSSSVQQSAEKPLFPLQACFTSKRFLQPDIFRVWKDSRHRLVFSYLGHTCSLIHVWIRSSTVHGEWKHDDQSFARVWWLMYGEPNLPALSKSCSRNSGLNEVK